MFCEGVGDGIVYGMCVLWLCYEVEVEGGVYFFWLQVLGELFGIFELYFVYEYVFFVVFVGDCMLFVIDVVQFVMVDVWMVYCGC